MFLKIVELVVPFKAFTSQSQLPLLSLFVSFRPVPILQREGALAFQKEASVRSGDVILRGGGGWGPHQRINRCGQGRAWVLPWDGVWGPLCSGDICSFTESVPSEQAWGLEPNRSSSATVEGMMD